MNKPNFALVIIPVLLVVMSYVSILKANDYLKSWIPSTCCVTNDCCWEIQESEVRELPDQHVEIKATGQVKRYDFSPDGKFYRCACDHNPETKNWDVHNKANTRCVFIPGRGS